MTSSQREPSIDKKKKQANIISGQSKAGATGDTLTTTDHYTDLLYFVLDKLYNPLSLWGGGGKQAHWNKPEAEAKQTFGNNSNTTIKISTTKDAQQ